MRVALAFASWVVAMGIVIPAWPARAERSKGLSLEQIRSVMRANASEFSACHKAAAKERKRLYGPFVYQIEVDKRGKVISVRPYQPSPVASFDKCVTDVLKRARFPGGPASVEAPLVFESS
jgi:outer membrane biosynthesis protein TonB